MADDVAADTNILSYLTKASDQSAAYQALLGNRRIAISFQADAELRGFTFRSSERQQRLQDLLRTVIVLPQSEATSICYARIASRRRELRKERKEGGEASDADMWIIASALEHRLPLLSHDKQQVQLARAMGLRVLTNLPELRDSNPKI